MTALYVKPVGKTKDGARIVEAFILADTKPNTLPTTGAGIKGLAEDDVFAPFSQLFVVEDADTKLFLADESGHFVAQ